MSRFRGLRVWRQRAHEVSLCALLCLAGAAVSAAQAADVTVVDDRGVRTVWSAPPQRIVSLLPSLTETVCELGHCARLVGTDRYSNHPASVKALPKTGGLDDANLEQIVALRPDVVLLALSARVTDRLEALGIRVVALEPRTHDDVRRVAGTVARLLGQPAAGERLWARLEGEINQAASAVPPGWRGQRVYYEVDSAPYAAGAVSFIGHTLARLGLKNIVPDALGPFPKLNPEFVVRGEPQLIMVSARQATTLPARPGWSRIPAVQHGRICAFSAEQGDVLSRPGPRMGEAARIMAACLQRLAPPSGGTP